MKRKTAIGKNSGCMSAFQGRRRTKKWEREKKNLCGQCVRGGGRGEDLSENESKEGKSQLF